MLRLVDRYQVLGSLGAGGMGEVFVAHDATLDRPVAIKRLLDTVNTEPDLERLRREARLNAQLQHPNIVTVYDVVRHEGVDHIVSELVDGDSLRDLVTSSRPSVSRAIEIAIEIARGLEFAHSRKVIHRDLKTENVLIGRDGSVKITDFGIAHSRGEPGAAVIAAAGEEEKTPLGTPRVMSPEQSRGEPTDERSDLFSLGVLIYEITASASPFLCGSKAQTVRAVQTAHHRPLADFDAAIPVELSQLVDRLLEKQPSRRPQSATEVIASLTAIRDRIAAESPASPSALQRRRVAVLCLKMDTEATGFVEAERAAERFAAFYVRVVADAAKSGGEVVSAVGGEIVIGFGHVRASEQDCERAAALAMTILSLRDLGDDVRSSLRAGLDVGDLYVGSGADKPLIVGPTIAHAARLARAVGPGELLVTMRAQSRLAGRYQLVPRTAPDLGPCYEVVGRATTNAPSNLAAPLVGREGVASTIRSVMARPRSSGARIIALEGEAGVGKSRLIQELGREWDARGAAVHVARGMQETQYSPFGALRPMLSMAFGLEPAQSADVARRRIVEGVTKALQTTDADDAIAALAVVCGCSTDADRDRVRSLYQREQRRDVEDAVVALLASEARAREVVVIAEDAHWFDVSSWDVFARLISEPEGVAVVTTYRSGWDDAWAGAEGVTHLTLARLGAVDARRLIAALVPTELASSLVDRIIEASAGLPLVLEELTRACVAGTRADADTDPLAAISSSLGDQVAATLEQLGPVLRRPLELAALLGLSVDRAQLALATGDGPQYAEYVTALVERGLLRTDAADSPRLSFPHPLVREEVARRIDRARRLELHRRIVELFDSDPGRFPARPETLAHHCEAGALPERAIEAWLRAGMAAADDGAHATALEHFDRALALVPTCAAEARATELEAAVRSSRGASLAMLGGWGAEAVATNSRQLAAVLRRSGGHPNPMTLWQSWAVGYATGNMPAIMQSIGQIEDLVATSPDPGIFHYLLHCARGITYLHLGRLPQARQSLESAERERPTYLPMLRELGQPEPVVSPTAYLAWVDLLVGERNAAFARQTDAETSPSLDPAHRSCAASFGATLSLAALNLSGAMARAGVVLSPAGVGLALQHKAAAGAIRALGRLHEALYDESVDVGETIRTMRAGFEEWRSGFMRPGALVLCVGMAEACIAIWGSERQPQAVRDLASKDAREILDFSLHEVTTLDPSIHRYYASEVFRVEAIWQRRAGSIDRAATALREARVRAQRLDCGEHGGPWLLLDRIAATSAGQA